MKNLIKERVSKSHYLKYTGVAPEGFLLIPCEVLDKLKEFDNWKEWINNEEFLEKLIIDYCNRL